MRSVVLICSGLALGACNAGGMHFRDVPPVNVEVLQSEFQLRRKGDLVQVIRISREYAPRLSQQLGRRAEIAVEQTYGCPVDRLRGDATLMLAYLKCGEPDDLARIGNGM